MGVPPPQGHSDSDVELVGEHEAVNNGMVTEGEYGESVEEDQVRMAVDERLMDGVHDEDVRRALLEPEPEAAGLGQGRADKVVGAARGAGGAKDVVWG